MIKGYIYHPKGVFMKMGLVLAASTLAFNLMAADVVKPEVLAKNLVLNHGVMYQDEVAGAVQDLTSLFKSHCADSGCSEAELKAAFTLDGDCIKAILKNQELSYENVLGDNYGEKDGE
jgi:hypothetical protein